MDPQQHLPRVFLLGQGGFPRPVQGPWASTAGPGATPWAIPILQKGPLSLTIGLFQAGIAKVLHMWGTASSTASRMPYWSSCRSMWISPQRSQVHSRWAGWPVAVGCSTTALLPGCCGTTLEAYAAESLWCASMGPGSPGIWKMYTLLLQTMLLRWLLKYKRRMYIHGRRDKHGEE